jgi:hypothetical protein
MAKRIEEEALRISDPDDIKAQIREYARVKATIEMMDARSKELRDKLFIALDADGYEDEKGNIQLDLDETIEGIVRLEKQRRVTRRLNEAKAEEIIDAKGIADDVYEMKRVINEDALMAAFYEEKITEDELDEMFPASVVWALRTLKK